MVKKTQESERICVSSITAKISVSPTQPPSEGMAWMVSEALQVSSGSEAPGATGLVNVVFRPDSVSCGGGCWGKVEGEVLSK